MILQVVVIKNQKSVVLMTVNYYIFFVSDAECCTKNLYCKMRKTISFLFLLFTNVLSHLMDWDFNGVLETCSG